MTKFIYRILVAGILPVMIFTGCSEKPDIDNTVAVKMAGEWFVEYYDDADPTVVVNHHDHLLTYNTSDPNSGQIWVEDPSYWPFKAKMNVDYNNMTFGAMDNTSNTEIPGKTIKVYEGKILPKAGHSKTGNLVDSIYLKLEFSDDPGTIYQVRGHMRTGFFEDEY